MKATIQVEPFCRNLILETEDIIARNYEETSHFHEPLDINWEMYMLLGDSFIPFVMRDENYKVVGVLFFVLDKYPHIQKWNMAQQLTFYVEPKFRRYSLKMVQLSEQYFKDIGVDVIIQSARYDTGFCDVLDAKGYQRADITYTKRIS